MRLSVTDSDIADAKRLRACPVEVALNREHPEASPWHVGPDTISSASPERYRVTWHLAAWIVSAMSGEAVARELRLQEWE